MLVVLALEVVTGAEEVVLEVLEVVGSGVSDVKPPVTL